MMASISASGCISLIFSDVVEAVADKPDDVSAMEFGFYLISVVRWRAVL